MPGMLARRSSSSPSDQVRPSGPFAVIGVDVLPDQRDFTHAIVGEPQHVVDDFRDRTGYFGAAGIGHHAKRAKLVATFLHSDERRNAAGADRCRVRRRQKAELVLNREFGLQRAAVAFCLRQKLRQMMVALRTDHDIDGGRAADDLRAFRLRDAAGHRDADSAALARRFVLHHAQPPEFGVDLFGGLFADVTGVENHQVRVIHAWCLDKALGRQRVHHALRIVDVHLTAV